MGACVIYIENDGGLFYLYRKRSGACFIYIENDGGPFYLNRKLIFINIIENEERTIDRQKTTYKEIENCLYT